MYKGGSIRKKREYGGRRVPIRELDHWDMFPWQQVITSRDLDRWIDSPNINYFRSVDILPTEKEEEEIRGQEGVSPPPCPTPDTIFPR